MNKTLLFLSTLLMTSFSETRSQTPGENLFDRSEIHEIRIKSLYEGLYDTLTNNYILSFGFGQIQTRKIPYAPALLEIDGHEVDTIAIRHKGFNSWWSSVKKPMKIDVNRYKDQDYDGLSKFNLHNGSGDPSFIRENLSYYALHELGIKVPRTAFAKVYLDSEYMGLYRLVEQVDNTFLDVNFGDHKGNLYAQQSNGSGGYGLEWISANQEDYYHLLELQNHQSINDWSNLLEFLDLLNNASDSEFKAEIASIFEVEDFLKVVAFDLTINNYDWYGNSGRNYYLAEIEGKIHWLPWDYNLTWRENDGALAISPNDYPLLIQRILMIPEHYDTFLQQFCEINSLFTSDKLHDFINSEADMIDSYLKNDPYADYDYEVFQTNIHMAWNDYPGLTQFVSTRAIEIHDMLATQHISCDLITGTPDAEDLLKIYPIPAQNDLHVLVKTTSQSNYHIVDMSGKIILKGALPNNSTIDVRLLTPGYYRLVIETAEKNISKGFIINR